MSKIPAILQGESLTRLIQGACIGAVATMVVGFYWGGWSLNSTAQKMAKEKSNVAVVAVLAPVCAEKFRALPDYDCQAGLADQGRSRGSAAMNFRRNW